MSQIRYGVTIEFTVDGIIEGGPSRAEVRNYLRRAVEGWRGQFLGDEMEQWASLSSVRIKYLHEATSSKKGPAR